MPLYEFRCGTCLHEFEALCRNAHAEEVACPECEGHTLSRLISRFAVSRALTPCGTPAAEAVPTCGFNAKTGGCGHCRSEW